jgi:hypothetical protein
MPEDNRLCSCHHEHLSLTNQTELYRSLGRSRYLVMYCHKFFFSMHILHNLQTLCGINIDVMSHLHPFFEPSSLPHGCYGVSASFRTMNIWHGAAFYQNKFIALLLIPLFSRRQIPPVTCFRRENCYCVMAVMIMAPAVSVLYFQSDISIFR